MEKLETIRASISTRMKHVYTMEWCTSVRMNGLELYMCTYMNVCVYQGHVLVYRELKLLSRTQLSLYSELD